MTKKAFTIVELLLYMGLVSVILVILGTVFFDLVNLQLSSQATSTVEQDGRFLLSRLAYDIHRASSVTTPASIGVTGNTLALVIAGSAYTYSQVGSDLQLTTPQGTYNLNTQDTQMDSFQITRLGNVSGQPSLRITLTLTSLGTDLGQNSRTLSLQTTYTLRQ